MKKLIGTKEEIAKAEEKRNLFISDVQMISEEVCLEISEEEGFPQDFNYKNFQLICKIILLNNSATWWLKRKLYISDIIMIAKEFSNESLK